MNYRNFYKIFLAEMPWHVPGSNDFLAQLEMLRETLDNYPENAEELSKNLYKISVGNQAVYWIGTEDLSSVLMIVDTVIRGDFCQVVLTSKNPLIPKGAAPFASDIYMAIKNDIKSLNLVFTSDSIMTTDALGIWSRLLADGSAISVYNTDEQKYELKNIKSDSELKSFFGDLDQQKYIYVISESNEVAYGLKHQFDIMELKRNTLYPLFENYKGKI